MATPHPACRRFLARANEGGGLRIMNDDQILRELHALPVLFVVGQENFPRRSSQLVFAAVQSIVESFGHFEEIVASCHYIPVGGDFEFSQHGNETIQHFGHASTDGGGVDHLDRLSLEFASEKTQFVELGRADNCSVVIDVRRWTWGWRRFPRSRSLAPLRMQGLSGEHWLVVFLLRGKGGWRFPVGCSLRLQEFHCVFIT